MTTEMHNTGSGIETSPDTDSAAPAATRAAPGETALDRLAPVCGDLEMRIARDGTWFYHGSPIGRKRLVRLFATVLKREPDGQYYLETPVEKGRIEVEDAPFVAVAVTVSGEGSDASLRFRTNLDDETTAGPDCPIRVDRDSLTGEPSPYVMVRDGLEALIARAVYYELVSIGGEHAVEGETLFGVWSEGVFFSLGPAPETE